MARSARAAILWRLSLLGFLQLVLLGSAVVGVGAILRRMWSLHPPTAELPSPADDPDQRPTHHHHHGPPLLPPLLTFSITGLVIVGMGAFVTERWIVRPLLLAERQLLANVSHELRTPLARLRVALDIAAESESGSGPKSTAEMERDLAEVESLLDDILTATRFDIQQGRPEPVLIPLHREPISPSALANGAAERFRSHHPARPLRLELAEEAPDVSADPIVFRRALDNLLENAHKYSPDETRPIYLRLTARNRRIVIEVADEGIGVASEDLRHVFAPFFRVDRSRSRATGGVGLGLTIVKRIVEAHEGTVSMESEPGKGSRVKIELPAVA